METVTNPHDKLFRETWSDRPTAQDFLQHHLPHDVLVLLDLESLEIAKDSFIEEDLRDYYSDLLYGVKIAGRPGYVYILFEHKSFPARFIHLQLLDYMLKIWRLFLKQKKRGGIPRTLPIIIPVVLFHGQDQWTVPIIFSELFSGPTEQLLRYIPNFGYLLHDLTQYADAEIKGAVLSRIVLLLFKHIFDPDFAQQLPGIFALTRELLRQDNGLRCLEMILRYVFSATENISVDQLHTMLAQSLSEKQGAMVMTLAKQLEQQGYAQGMQQGIRQGLLEGIELALEVKFGEQGHLLMPAIQSIHDLTHLEAIKEVIKTSRDVSGVHATIHSNLTAS